MKKAWIYIAGALMGVMILGAVLIQVQKKPVDSYTKRVTFIAALASKGHWGRIADSAIKEGETFGMDVKCLAQTDLTSDKVVENMETAINAEADGIISYGLSNSEQFEKSLKMAGEKGIPVILVDSDVDTEQKLCYVGTDNYESGKTVGNRMKEKCEGKGEILCVVSDRDVFNQQERLRGFQDALSDCPQMKIVGIVECQSNKLIAKKGIIGEMKKNPQIRGIFCAEGTGTYACAQLMEQWENDCEQELMVFGYDFNSVVENAIENGFINGTVQQDSRSMGRTAMDVMQDYLKDGMLPQKEIYTDILLVEKENLKQAETISHELTDVPWHFY